MQDTFMTLWMVAVGVICLVGLFLVVKSVSKAMDADTDIKRAIREGEIDNFSE